MHVAQPEGSVERSHQRTRWAWCDLEGTMEGMREERSPLELLLCRRIRKTSARPALVMCAVLLFLANSASSLHFAQPALPALRVPSAPGMMARCSSAGAFEHGGDSLEHPADLRFPAYNHGGGFFVEAPEPHPTQHFSQTSTSAAPGRDYLTEEAGSFAAPHVPTSEGDWRTSGLGGGVRQLQLVETPHVDASAGPEAWETVGGDRMCGGCGVLQVAFGIPLRPIIPVMAVGGGEAGGKGEAWEALFCAGCLRGAQDVGWRAVPLDNRVRPCSLHPGPETVNSKPSTFNPQPSTLNPQP